jgi:hypothetical protein
VKKCASCSKDLPEAALHCVFCGAKQAPAPAVPASNVAKTAFGYSANEVMQQLGRDQPPQQQPSYQPPPPPRAHPGSQPPPGHPQQGGPTPQAAANAATMFVPGGGSPPQQQYNPPQQQPYNPPQQHNPSQQYGNPQPGFGAPSPGYPQAPPAYAPPPASGGMGIHSPQQSTPAPLPTVPSPYLGAQTGVTRGPRPIEPWRDSLKLMMIVWGAVGLAAFATPVMTDPMAFNWDAIINGEGSAKIPGLLWAGVALLSIGFAVIPMMTLPRGALAAVLGLAGIFVPMAVTTFPPWQLLVPMIGSIALIVGLLVRNEYTESLVARVLVTIGSICWLAPYLIPEHGQIPLVQIIKVLLDGANHMEIVIIALAQIVLAVLCLLVWMPGPATAGAKIFAWAVILFPVASFAIMLLNVGHVGDLASKAPGMLLLWVIGATPGGDEMIGMGLGVLYSVLVGYGMATVIGKQLE